MVFFQNSRAEEKNASMFRRTRLYGDIIDSSVGDTIPCNVDINVLAYCYLLGTLLSSVA